MILHRTMLLGGALELEVPIEIDVIAHKAWRSPNRMEPDEPAYLEVNSVRRTDRLEWHDGCGRAFDAWWENWGRADAEEQMAADEEAAEEYAAEMRAEMKRAYL